MSEHVDDDELKQLLKSGAKILSRKPAAKAPVPEATDAQKIIATIQSLGPMLAALANRKSPDVNVAAPKIVFEPKIDVEAKKEPREWEVEVVERDKTADQRIKKLKIKPVY